MGDLHGQPESISRRTVLRGVGACVALPWFKDFLLANREVVLEQLANRLLISALGRGLEASDQCVADRMVAAVRQAEYRFSALVLELVSSIPFTHRQNPEY